MSIATKLSTTQNASCVEKREKKKKKKEKVFDQPNDNLIGSEG